MNLDSLMRNIGEWLQGTGPESDIIISTRIRLARNLVNYPFTNRANLAQKSEIETRLRDTLTRIDYTPRLHYVDVQALNPLDRQMLVERQLMSRALASAEGPRGVAFDERESVGVMINEEDHLRLQVMRSGLALDDAWREIDRLDDMIEAHVSYSYHEQFGYLTACPTNVGTGMRASVMMHLPGIFQTKQLDKTVRSLQKINLVVRGLYGEGSRAFGEFFQISNQVTLGKSETQALTEIRDVILNTIQLERRARSILLREKRQSLQDHVARALGTLQSATMMTSEETMELLSIVRLGIHLQLMDDAKLTMPFVNELFLQTQPAHLQKLMGTTLDGEERNAARARYLRNRLRELGAGAV